MSWKAALLTYLVAVAALAGCRGATIREAMPDGGGACATTPSSSLYYYYRVGRL